MNKLLFILSPLLFGLFSCQKDDPTPENVDCHKMWTVESTCPYKVTHNEGKAIFEIQQLTDNRFMIFQQAARKLRASAAFSAKIRMRDLTVSGTPSSVVGERLSLFIGYNENGKIEPHVGVAISRGDIHFLKPNGAERRAFFSPSGDYMNYEILFWKNAYGHMEISVKNLLTDAVVSDIVEKITESSEPYFCLMANSTLSSRFGNIEKLSFGFEQFEFGLFPYFSNDLFKCDFLQEK